MEIKYVEGEMMHLDELFKTPTHFRIYNWPGTELKKLHIVNERKFPDRRYFLRIVGPIPAGNSTVTVEICQIDAIDVRTRTFNYVRNVIVEGRLTMPVEVFNHLKKLISNEYGDLLAKEKKETGRKFVSSKISDIELSKFCKGLTQEFCVDFCGTDGANIFNVDTLTVSAMDNFKDVMYALYVRFVERKVPAIPAEDQRFLSRKVFHENYPALLKITSNIEEAYGGGDYPNGEAFDEGDIKKINLKYNTKLLQFVTERIKLVK